MIDWLIPPHRIDVTPIHVLHCSVYKNFALNWLCFYSFKPTVLRVHVFSFFLFSLLYILSICHSTVLVNKCWIGQAIILLRELRQTAAAYKIRRARLLLLRSSSMELSTCWLWPPYGIGQAIIFLPCSFFLLLSSFSSPNLSGRRMDVYHTSTHDVILVRI